MSRPGSPRPIAAPTGGPTIALDPEQRSRLLAAKLAALVRAEHPDAPGDGPAPGGFGGIAAVAVDGVAWVLADPEADPSRSVGPALAWAGQRSCRDVHLVVDGPVAGVVARRASYFATPVRVSRLDGRTLTPATPTPFEERQLPDPDALALIGLLEEAGVDVSVEHGEILGEVLGLEMARVVPDEQTGARVEVGVGRHDREAFGMLHGDVPTANALRQVIDAVRAHRRAGAPAHPLNRLAGERWLRARLVAEPTRVGAKTLVPIEGTVRRAGVKDVVPAPAVGALDDGTPVVVVASVGIDLDLVPAAADARAAHHPDAELVLVVPERDVHPVTERLAAALHHPARVVGLPGDWRA